LAASGVLAGMAAGPAKPSPARAAGRFGDRPVKQSRTMSLVEAIANVAVGFLLALLTQIAIFPMFGLVVSVGENVLIGGIFTAVSIMRSYALRRLFEAVRRVG
jgi:hypothetical protein